MRDLWRLIAFAMDGITAFSNLPLRFWGMLGAVIAGISLIYGVSPHHAHLHLWHRRARLRIASSSR